MVDTPSDCISLERSGTKLKMQFSEVNPMGMTQVPEKCYYWREWKFPYTLKCLYRKHTKEETGFNFVLFSFNFPEVSCMKVPYTALHFQLSSNWIVILIFSFVNTWFMVKVQYLLLLRQWNNFLPFFLLPIRSLHNWRTFCYYW